MSRAGRKRASMTERAAAKQIKPRRVSFDWSDTPLHWIPGDAQTTHTINVLHLLLPAGERWFVDLYRDALPLVTDDALRRQVKGFMGQEAVHSRSHQAVLDHLLDQGLDPRPYTRQIDRLFEVILGDAPFGARVPRWLQRSWLLQRLAIVAAIEHFTAVLGAWVLDADALDAAGADPTMLDLLRWHGAEEVEHRSVAFDLYQHLSGSYVRRAEAMSVTFAAMSALWAIGTAFMMAADPTGPGWARPHRFVDAGRRGLLPTMGNLVGAVPRYMRPWHHPSSEASTERALAYLATSPAATAVA